MSIACAGYGDYIIHTLEHFRLNILRSVNGTTNITLAELVLFIKYKRTVTPNNRIYVSTRL